MKRAMLFVLIVLGLSFSANVENCFRIDSPGVYTANASYGGAPYDSGTGMNACMVINSSNVVFDCAGRSITGYGDSIGVFVNHTTSGSLSNVTIRNCNISNYQYGIYTWSSYPYPMHGCEIANNSLSNVNEDLLLILADDCEISGNRLARSTNIQSVSDSVIRGNVMGPAGYCHGMFLGAIWTDTAQFNDNVTITGNSVSGCDDVGFDIDYLANSFVGNNTALMNGYSGFDFSECNNNTMAGNAARNNSLSDIYTAGFVISGANNTLEGNIAENNSNGFDVFFRNNTLRDNHAFHNLIGMTLEGKTYDCIVENNLLEDNVFVDLIVAGNAREMRFNRMGCSNTIVNNTGSGGRPIFFSNDTGTVLNGGTYSEVILCGAGQSRLSGVTVSGSDDFANNGFMIIHSNDTMMDGLVSEDNAAGLWLYGCDNCRVTNGRASGNAVGYLVTYSGNVSVSGVKSFGNNQSLANVLGGKGPMAGILTMLVNGSGIVEMNQMPKTPSGAGAQTNAPVPARSLYSNNTYTNIEVYGNRFGMALLGTGNVTISRSQIHDNDFWGIADMAGNSGNSLAVRTSDTALYRNGKDFLSIFSLVLGSQDRGFAGTFESEEGPTMPTLPEGFIWGEYLQFSMLYHMMLDDGYDNPAEWAMSRAGHGASPSSVLLWADDGAESVYVTSETNLPAWKFFNFTNDMNENVNVYLNFTNPDNNKTPVNGGYFMIIGVPNLFTSECQTYCGWGCFGQEPGCYYYDTYGNCVDCLDVNQNNVCDNFECIDTNPSDGQCDSGCTDANADGMCDFCDPQLPAIENFGASPGNPDGYDMGSLELYYLNITNMSKPVDVSAATVIGPPPVPINKTWYIDGEWLPVPEQYLETGVIWVDNIELPPSQLFGDIGGGAGITGSGSEGSGLYQGIYALFALPAASDNGEPAVGPEEPGDNETPPECAGDDGCAVNEICTNGMCVRFPCECGEYKDHGCAEYECCSDSQCAAGQTCLNHYCRGGEEKPGCTADSQCPATSFCDISPGADTGSCEPVNIKPCGEIRDHQFVPYGYECGPEPGCPSCPGGEFCTGHRCVQSEVSCPTTGFVGDEKSCEAKEDGAACPNCEYVITAPNGWTYSGMTDDDGNFQVPLQMKGAYSVALMKDGRPVRTIQVQAYPQAQPAEEEKQAEGGADTMFFLWLATLLALVVVSILYWKSSSGRK